jgi:hypothetical protein
LVACHDPHRSGGADGNLIDVLRRHLGLNDELVSARHNQHDRLTSATNDTTDGMSRKLMNHPGLRRPDNHALKFVLSGRAALPQLGDLPLRFAEIS